MESFLKGVRSQVEISKVKEEEEEKVEEDIHGVAEEANEVVPKKDMVTLKKESVGDVATVKDIDQDAGDANQGGLGGEGGGEQE